MTLCVNLVLLVLTGEGIIEEDKFDFEVTGALKVVEPEDWETTVDQSFSE